MDPLNRIGWRPHTVAGTLASIGCALILAPVVVSADSLLPEEAGAATDLYAWLQAHPEDASWLASGTKERPRAWIDLQHSNVQVVLKLPEGVTAATIEAAVMNYDVYRRTSDVETSFQADGAFFTGTRVMGTYSPTVTSNSVVRTQGTLNLSWTEMSGPAATVWLEAHRGELQRSMIAAGMDAEPEDVSDYIRKLSPKLDTVASVVGSHQFVDGWYRYHQEIQLKSRILDSIARKLGRARQYRAALKAACFSTGQFHWAGAAGKIGQVFATRGNVGDEVSPGK